MAENMAALRRGAVDVVQLFQPLAEELIEDGDGHLWYAAATRGPCSYTTFYARRRRSPRARGVVASFAASTARRNGCTPADPRQSPMRCSHFSRRCRPRCCRPPWRAIKTLGIWGRNPILPRDGYDRLRAGLISARFAKQAAPFEQAVDNTLAEEIVRENPRALEG